MPDWNSDGKNDYHDDYAYNQILKHQKRDVPSRGMSWNGLIECLGACIGLLALLLFLSVLASLLN